LILYVARRLGAGLVIAVLATFITYSILSLSFRNVVITSLGPGATGSVVDARMHELGWDRPLLLQYVDWVVQGLGGDFGTSMITGEPVVTAVSSRLAVTLSLVVTALVITLAISVALGVWAAVSGGAADRLAQGLSLIGYVVPGLLLAIALVVILAINLQLLPATGYTPFSEDPGQWLKSITIPVIVLVIAGAANITAQIRGSMVDELSKDYVRTLRTHGIPIRSIVLKHAMRNAAGPALTVLSFEFITMLGSAMIIENVFALPGYGSFTFLASLQGDIPVIMGVTVFGVLLVTTVNLVVDMTNGWLNPKARIH
jgi:peptide/nickel transport system permease protein